MDRQDWHPLIVDFLTEISIVGTLVGGKIDRIQPEGLDEVGISILSILAKTDGVGIARETIVWMLERAMPNADDAVSLIMAQGYIVEQNGVVLRTDAGRMAFERAIAALLPAFEPAFQGIDRETIAHSTTALREIRRTLDNLPDQ